MEESERMIGMKTWNEKRRENRAFFMHCPDYWSKGKLLAAKSLRVSTKIKGSLLIATAGARSRG